MSELLKPMVYPQEDLEPISVPVDLGGKKLVLRQATPAVVSRHESAKLKGGRINKDGSVTLAEDDERLSKLKLTLVTGCLFEEYAKGSEVLHRPVSQAWVEQNVPHWVLDDLYERAKLISRIDQDWTVPALKEYIHDLQERLARMESKESDLKNSESATAAPST